MIFRVSERTLLVKISGSLRMMFGCETALVSSKSIFMAAEKEQFCERTALQSCACASLPHVGGPQPQHSGPVQSPSVPALVSALARRGGCVLPVYHGRYSPGLWDS